MLKSRLETADLRMPKFYGLKTGQIAEAILYIHYQAIINHTFVDE